VGRSSAEPSFFVVALSFVLMLCAHAWCFVLCAPCSCFLLIGFLGHRSPSTKHEACAPSRWPAGAGQSSCSQNRVFLWRTAKHKAQSMSTKQPILTKRSDFEHKARSAKNKAQSMSRKQRQKNWAQSKGESTHSCCCCCCCPYRPLTRPHSRPTYIIICTRINSSQQHKRDVVDSNIGIDRSLIRSRTNNRLSPASSVWTSLAR
jgi:hypothetical protein